MSRWEELAATLDVMFQGNFPDFHRHQRGRTFTRPSSPKTSGPPRFLYYDFAADPYEIESQGRTRVIPGAIQGYVFCAGNQGDDEITRFLDRLDVIADAWAATESANSLYFHAVVPDALEYEGDAEKPQWSARAWRLPFLYVSPVSPEGVGVLGGISSSTLQINAPALASLDFVGPNAGSWQRVKAAEGEPSCRGMVSLVGADGARTIVLSGFVRIAGGHGFTIGPLYLSQDTPGAATITAYQSGILRQVAEVLNETDLIVLGDAQDLDLGGGA